MPPTVTRPAGRLYQQAAEFDAQLLARETAAADQMLAAWTNSYWNVRRELDQLLAKIAQAKAEGAVLSPAWAYQQGRLKSLLDTAKTEVARYSHDASKAAVDAQRAAVRAAQVHADKLAKTAIQESLGYEASLALPDPTALIRQAVGFMGDGGVLATHLTRTLTGETVDGIRATILKGLALGKGQDWFVREVTRNYALAHSRAVTIMRTETLRVYRETSRTTYAANSDVLDGWTWSAHKDGACCIACAVMDGTIHGVDETLDGHPRCRCAMIPRTKSWEDLGVKGLPDLRPPVPSGKAWVEAQTPLVQRALMGPRKFDAWTKGEISLDDMVARHESDDWGTMRTERSLKSIRANRNANPAPRYVDDLPEPVPAPPAPKLPTTPPEPVVTVPEPVKPSSNAWQDPPLPTSNKFTDTAMVDYRERLRIMPDDVVAAQLEQKDAAVRTLVQHELDRRDFYTQNPFGREPDPWTMTSRYTNAELKTIQDVSSIWTDEDLAKGLAERLTGPLADDAAAAIMRQEQWFRRAIRQGDIPTLERILADLPQGDTLALDTHRRALEAVIDHKTFEPPWPKLPDGPEAPEVALTKVNPLWKTEPDRRWDRNCTNCTASYELRRRGWDVLAQSRRKGRNQWEIDRLWDITGAERYQMKGTPLQFRKAIESTMPEGARGFIACDWIGGGGHIFNWEIIDGKMVLFDAQPGEVKDFDVWRRSVKGHVSWARLDNRPLTSKLNEFLLDFSTDPTTP